VRWACASGPEGLAPELLDRARDELALGSCGGVFTDPARSVGPERKRDAEVERGAQLRSGPEAKRER
jgi:hypothetical protein